MVFARPLGLVSALMMRSALMRRIGVAMALVAAALVLASSVVGSLSLANSQAAERDLGEFEFGATAGGFDPRFRDPTGGYDCHGVRGASEFGRSASDRAAANSCCIHRDELAG